VIAIQEKVGFFQAIKATLSKHTRDTPEPLKLCWLQMFNLLISHKLYL
jgi:hypothetical protein